MNNKNHFCIFELRLYSFHAGKLFFYFSGKKDFRSGEQNPSVSLIFSDVIDVAGYRGHFPGDPDLL
jgi:hypothetical protein